MALQFSYIGSLYKINLFIQNSGLGGDIFAQWGMCLCTCCCVWRVYIYMAALMRLYVLIFKLDSALSVGPQFNRNNEDICWRSISKCQRPLMIIKALLSILDLGAISSNVAQQQCNMKFKIFLMNNKDTHIRSNMNSITRLDSDSLSVWVILWARAKTVYIEHENRLEKLLE